MVLAQLIRIVEIPERLQRVAILVIAAVTPQIEAVINARRKGVPEESGLAEILRPFLVEEVAVARLRYPSAVVRAVVDGVAERELLYAVPVIPGVAVELRHQVDFRAAGVE